MKQIKLSFLAYYYLLKSLLFKVLLLNPRAKQAIVKRCSEDIIFWLEFFVKLPHQNMGIGDKVAERGTAPLCGKGHHASKNNSPVPTRQEEDFFNKHETKKGEALSDSLGSSPFLKGLGKDSEATERSRASLDKKTGIGAESTERGDAPLCGKGDHPPEATERSRASLDKNLGSKPFSKGLGDLSLSNRIQQLKTSFKPQTTYKTYFWLKYKKDYILELKARIEKDQPLLVAKSANMDETICTALVLLWFWLYKENANFYTLGQTVKHLYYTKNSYSIFNLYKYVLNHLPYSLHNIDHPPPKNSKNNKLPYSLIVNRKKKFFIKLENLNNGNVLYGFSGAKRNYFPQHKKIKGVWFSDFAFHRKQKEHYQALQNISSCMIITSIPNGKGNLFYELSLNKDLDHYKLHWLLNPHYDDIWYKKVVLNIDLNHIHQFLDIGFDYKIRRQRLIKQLQPVKKAAKKVEVIQTTTRNNRSTFYKTFIETKTPLKMYHRNAKSIYTPESYELAKKSLANASLRAVNIPAVRENSNDIVYLRWQKMNKLVRQNNYAQITSVKTALKVLFHYQPDLTAYLLQQPQMAKVNCKINNNYERIHFKTLFPYAITKNNKFIEEHSRVPVRREDALLSNQETKKQSLQSEEQTIDHINKLSVRKYNPNSGIAGEACERKKGRRSRQEESGIMPPPLNGHCEELSDAAILHTSNLNNNHETSTTKNNAVRKATKGGVCGSGRSRPGIVKGEALNGLPCRGGRPGIEKSLSPENKQNRNLGIGAESTERGESPLCSEWHLPPPLCGHCEEQGDAAIQDQTASNPDNNQETSTTRNNAVRKATEGGVCGKGDHPPEFFEHYKKNRTYKVRSTKFNITIKPPKHKQNKSTGIDGSAVERGESPLCSKWHLPPPKHKQNKKNKEPEEPP